MEIYALFISGSFLGDLHEASTGKQNKTTSSCLGNIQDLLYSFNS